MINTSKIKDIREDHDLTQSQMAEILKVKRSTYSLWELGTNIIPLKSLIDFSNYFKLNIDYVLNLSKNKENEPILYNRKQLGEKIKNLRNKQGLSQEYIASILNVKQSCIVRYEKGLINITVNNLYKIAKEFNTSFTDLLK